MRGFPGGLVVNHSHASAEDLGSIPGLGRSPRGEDSGLENPMDRGAWRAIVHGVTESGRTEHTCVRVLWRKILHTLNPQQVQEICHQSLQPSKKPSWVDI